MSNHQTKNNMSNHQTKNNAVDLTSKQGKGTINVNKRRVILDNPCPGQDSYLDVDHLVSSGKDSKELLEKLDYHQMVLISSVPETEGEISAADASFHLGNI